MSLSKKNYVEIAKIISKSEYITDLIYNLANYFEKDNKAFNKNKFVNACVNTMSETGEYFNDTKYNILFTSSYKFIGLVISFQSVNLVDI